MLQQAPAPTKAPTSSVADVGPKSARPNLQGLSYDQQVAALDPNGGGGATKKPTKLDGAAGTVSATTGSTSEKKGADGKTKIKDDSTTTTIGPGNVGVKSSTSDKTESGPTVAYNKETGLYEDKKVDTTSSSQTSSTGYAGGKLSNTAGSATEKKNADGSGESKKQGKSASLDTKSGAFTWGSSESASKSDGKGNTTGSGKSTSNTIDIKNGTYKRGGSEETTTNDGKGTSTTQSTKGAVGIEGGQIVKESGKSKKTTDASGKEHETSTTKKNGVGFGKASAERGVGQTTNDPASGAQTQMGAKVGGGYTVDGKVVQDGKKWAVLWSRMAHVKGSAGGGGNNIKTGNGGKGEVGAKLEISDSGKKLFATKKDAEQWLTRAKATFGATIDGGGDVAGALAMTEGEQWAKGAAFGMSVAGGGTIGELSFGASGEIKGTTGATVKRLKGKTFEATRFHQTDAKGSLDLGAVFVTLSGSRGTSHKVETAIQFDLSTKAGQDNFEAYVSSGKLVNESYVKGAETITDVTTGERGLTFASLGASMSITNKSKVEETQTTGADGKVVKTTKGTNTKGYSVDLWGLYKESRTASNAIAGDNKGSGLAATTTVGGTGGGGKANEKDLAAASPNASTNQMARQDVKSSGTWTLSTVLDETQAGNAMSWIVQRPDAFAGQFGKDGKAAVDELREALVKVVNQHKGDNQAAEETRRYEGKRVISAWVAKHGAPAAKVIRAAGAAGSWDDRHKDTKEAKASGKLDNWLALAPAAGKKDYFLKPAEHAKLVKQAIEYREDLKKSPAEAPSIGSQAAQDKAELEGRLAFMTHDYYPDCPVELIEEQRARVIQLVKGLDEIVDGVRADVEGGAAALVADNEALKGPAARYLRLEKLRTSTRADDRKLRELMYDHDASSKEMGVQAYDKARGLRLTAQTAVQAAYAEDGRADQAYLMFNTKVAAARTSQEAEAEVEGAADQIQIVVEQYEEANAKLATASKAWGELKAANKSEFVNARGALAKGM
ncbi:MAG: hypothetical protein IT385_16080 [Deltaproteobacteria bacterium]|nr:hypothetical protein [Deltaproteobacteria bacterium]